MFVGTRGFEGPKSRYCSLPSLDFDEFSNFASLVTKGILLKKFG